MPDTEFVVVVGKRKLSVSFVTLLSDVVTVE
jgi:hypothetical protein